MNPPSLDLTPLRNAIAALEGAMDLIGDRRWFGEQPVVLQNTVVAGAIQSFEFVYELCFKMLRRRLQLDAEEPQMIDQASFRDVLRISAEQGLIDDVKQWFAFRDMRNASSHTYDKDKAADFSGRIPSFLDAARALLRALEARNG